MPASRISVIPFVLTRAPLRAEIERHSDVKTKPSCVERRGLYAVISWNPTTVTFRTPRVERISRAESRPDPDLRNLSTRFTCPLYESRRPSGR